MQGAVLLGAHMQGADLHNAQLQGADLHGADLSDSKLEKTFVFRADIGGTNLATAAIRDVLDDKVKPGENSGTGPLSQPDVDAWIALATQFAADKRSIVERFARLKPGFQVDARVPTWPGMQEASFALDPDRAIYRGRLTDRLGDLACDADGAPDVARGLIGRPDIDQRFGGRLAALGDQLDVVRNRMREARKNAEKCPGVAGFTGEDWRRLDALKGDTTPPIIRPLRAVAGRPDRPESQDRQFGRRGRKSC